MRGHARRAQARHGDDDLVRARALPDAATGPGRSSSPTWIVGRREPDRGSRPARTGGAHHRSRRRCRTDRRARRSPTRAHSSRSSIGKGRKGSQSVRAEETAAAIVAAGGRAMAVGAELTSTEQVGAMVERVAAELGPVGVLVTATSAYKSEKFAEISRRVLGFRRRRPARCDVPDVPRGRARDAGGRLGSHRQYRGTLRAGRRGALDALRGGQGRRSSA